jgi:hypothetical protein
MASSAPDYRERERERDSNHKLILLDGLQRTKNKQQQSQRNLNQNSIKKKSSSSNMNSPAKKNNLNSSRKQQPGQLNKKQPVFPNQNCREATIHHFIYQEGGPREGSPEGREAIGRDAARRLW